MMPLRRIKVHSLVLLSYPGFYWVSQGFHKALPSFTGFYRVLLGFARVFVRFYLVLLSCIGLYRDLFPTRVGSALWLNVSDVFLFQFVH